MAKPKVKPRTWTIISGPSKYDFLEALSFRKYPIQKVKMKLQERTGDKIEVREVQVTAVSKKSDHNSEDRVEGHLWGFVGNIDWDGTKGTYPIPIVGEYSTQSRTGRAIELFDRFDSLLCDALFWPFLPKTQP